jgi:hypothetical protein
LRQPIVKDVFSRVVNVVANFDHVFSVTYKSRTDKQALRPPLLPNSRPRNVVLLTKILRVMWGRTAFDQGPAPLTPTNSVATPLRYRLKYNSRATHHNPAAGRSERRREDGSSCDLATF